MTQLDRLLESIDPDRTLSDVAARTDDAINSFHMNRGSAKKWEEFMGCLIGLFCHVENTVLALDPPRSVNPEIDWGRCSRLLMEEYGKSGEKTAFELARTGVEGGLYGVMKALARRLAAQYVKNEISARISYYWDALTVDEKVAASAEYLEKYGHLLPSEITEGSAARVRANFTKVLEEHPRLIQRTRQVGR